MGEWLRVRMGHRLMTGGGGMVIKLIGSVQGVYVHGVYDEKV